MKGEEQFERRLQRHPQRRLPASWREEILNAATAVQPREPAPGTQVRGISALLAWLKGLLWPAPRAWAGLAAVWVLALAINLASREAAPQASANLTMASSPQVQELLREQRQLFTDLAGPRGSAEAIKPSIPQPRSQRRSECAMA